MKARSWLFAPGDSERKLEKLAACGADAVVLDLEDSVAPDAKPDARMMVRDWLIAHRQHVLAGRPLGRWVRINAVSTTFWQDDLGVALAGRPDGIVVPKAGGPDELHELVAELYEAEHHHGIEAGSTRIIAQVGETPASALAIADYARASLPRLAGLSWGSEDLAVSLGASRTHEETGDWTDTFRMVRAQVLLAAHARGVEAIDTQYADFRDLEGLQARAQSAAADGFTGMLAIHPDQVPAINAAFTPDEQRLEAAREIVDAFAAHPGSAVLELEGRMIERPHLLHARRLLERFG